MYDVQVAPPLIGNPGALPQVDLSSGEAPCGPAGRIALGLGNEEELPHDFAGFGVERVHAPLAALGVAPRVADENQTVPGDRSGGDEFALPQSAIVVRQIRLPVLKS